jgi:hypothetical protein
MERTFEIIPNFVDTILVYDIPANRKAFKKLEEPYKSLYKFENGECEIEFEYYDGVAYATDGSGLFMTYPKMDIIKGSTRRQDSICDYNGIYDSINQRDVCLRYGKLDCDPKNKAYVKRTASDAYKMAETFILLAADIYQNIYNMSEVERYDVAVILLHDAAIRFEAELNWQGGSEERDYILELEKFEEKELARIRSIFDTGDEEEECVDRNGRQIIVGSKVIWHDPEEEARDLSRVYDVDDIGSDMVYISDEFSEAEVLPQELEVVG